MTESSASHDGELSPLFRPGTIGGLTLKNRFVRSATAEMLGDEQGQVTDAWVRLYGRLARGGVGLIITGNFFVDQVGRALPRTPVLDSDRCLDGLRRLVAAAHEQEKTTGTAPKIVAQLNHGGRMCDPQVIGQRPLAPSAVLSTSNFVKPQAMTAAEIEQTIAAFGAAAGRARAAGFDGVQIHGAHGYLISQFLSPATNRRQDDWGGTPERRGRFLRRVVDAMRAATAPDYPILIKLGVVDQGAGGLTLAAALDHCEVLADRGIAAIEVSGGNNRNGFFSVRGDLPRDLMMRGRGLTMRLLYRTFIERLMIADSRFEESYFLANAAAVKRRVTIPILAVGGLRQLAVMERALTTGQADFISLSRPLIRQPSWIAKLERDPTATSSCVSCNRCILEVGFHQQPLKCYRSVKDKSQ